MIKFVCHPSGNDLNGGGYVPLTVGDDYSYAGTWSQWHNNFDALVVGTGLSVVQYGDYIKILGDFTNVPVGIMVYCDFTASYADGRYLVVEADSSHLGLAISYTADTTVNVRVGGAIKSPAAACTLAYGTDGNELLLPANQTTQTINEVDGNTNQILCTAEGATLEMYSVDDSTGVKITSDDSNAWAVIKAKTGSTWAADSIMLYFNAALNYSKIDKVVLDGNELVPRVVQLCSSKTNYAIPTWGDIVIQNSKSDGYGIYVNASTTNANSVLGSACKIKITNCYKGLFNSAYRSLFLTQFIWFNNCHYGLYSDQHTPHYLTINNIRTMLFTDCTVGLFLTKWGGTFLPVMTFANNDTDIQINKYDTTNDQYTLYNCLFYNDAENGENILVNDDDYVDIELINCVYGATGSGGAAFNGITPTLTNCQEITADPFVNKATGDYRLNPAFADLDKIYDWDKVTNVIGATTPAEPASGGGSGGVSASRIFGGL